MNDVVYACVGCGQSSAFNIEVVLIGLGFVLLPLFFVAMIALKIRKDNKDRSTHNLEQ